MDTVTESAMAVSIARQGGIGIIHRFLTVQEEVNEVLKVKRSGSVMIENPYVINPEKTVKNALSYMDEKGVSGLLVVDNDSKLIGILTSRDVMFESETKLVKDVMTRDVITGKPDIDGQKAKEIAIADSVTVSMFALIRGILSVIFFDSLVCRLV